MRSKIYLSIICLSLLFSFASIVLFAFTNMQIDHFKTPYGLSKNTVVFSVVQDYNDDILENEQYQIYDDIQTSNVVSEIYMIVKDADIVLINDNIDNVGLGVYDTSEKYMNSEQTISLSQLLSNNNIIIREDSYYNDKLAIETLSGKMMQIRDTYDESHILFNNSHDYIYNYFSDPTLGGTYYIESPDTLIVQEIVRVFEENNFVINYEQTYSYSTVEVMKQLLSNGIYLISVIGYIFIVINLAIIYSSWLTYQKKRIRVHAIYGSRYGRLLFSYTINNIVNVLPASIVGGVVYYLVFSASTLMLPLTFLIMSTTLAALLNIFVFAICFFSKQSIRPKKILNSSK